MNTNFHTINYYHKIIIQYIYLSYVKNDLVKIEESILDYIEFLIKFKYKTSPDNTYLLNNFYFFSKRLANSYFLFECYAKQIKPI